MLARRRQHRPVRCARGVPAWLRFAPLLLSLLLPSPAPAQAALELDQARSLRAGGRLAEAATVLEQRLRSNPEDIASLIELARIRLDQGDRPAAEATLRRALFVSPNSPDANDTLGTLLAAARRYPEAMDHFETTLAVAPADALARASELSAATALALEARAAGKPEAALLCLEHASEHLPGNADLLTDIGLVAGELHLYRRADRALTAALALDPANARALYTAGRIALEAGHLPEAEHRLRAYLVQKPDDATAHFGLGHVLALELNDVAATAEFERSLALQPAQTESLYQLGLLAAHAGDDRRAQSLFRRTLSRNPRHAGALTGLGQIAFRQQEYPAAEAALTSAVAAAPDLQPAHYYLGLTLARLGQASASRRELDRARELTAQQQSRATPELGEAPLSGDAPAPGKAPQPQPPRDQASSP